MEHDVIESTLELRKVQTLPCPQIERDDAPDPSVRNIITLSTYDFCNNFCLMNFLQKQNKTTP